MVVSSNYDYELISNFHRALLQSISFIIRLNALNYTNLEVKICVV